MRKLMVCACAFAAVLSVRGVSGAAEHGGKEHGGKEHGGKEHGGMKMPEPSDRDIRKAMSLYVKQQVKKTGSFEVRDEETDKTRKLKLKMIHKRVGKTGNYYYSCADFKDTGTGETVDVDLDVENKDGKLGVIDVRIHKVNGMERYTYDENDNRIPAEK